MVSYCSVVGMLLYLAGHTRPDIAYAVNCCARYMFCPDWSHELALKWIGQYLKATCDRGLVLNPSRELKIDCYPDADFAGMYGYKNSSDPSVSRVELVLSLPLPAVQSYGILSCKLKQHFRPFRQSSLPWLAVAKNFSHY